VCQRGVSDSVTVVSTTSEPPSFLELVVGFDLDLGDGMACSPAPTSPHAGRSP
jgi:hypothetical protein